MTDLTDSTFTVTPEDIEYFKEVKRKKIIAIVLKTIIYIVLCLWAFTTLFPFAWVLINSFKPKDNILTNSFYFPFKDFTFANYGNAFTGPYNLLAAYGNSFLISGTVVIFTVLISVFASFALARFHFRGNNTVFTAIVACMMFPIFATIYPVYSVFGNINLLNTRFAVILPQIAGNLAFTIILLTGFIKSLPIEIEESAYMDGASMLRTIIQIMFPMIKSAIATSVIFVFLWSYNDLFISLLMITNKAIAPVCSILNEISSQYGTDYGLMTASVALVAVPMIIVYIIFQKNIIKGLTAGAVKG